MRPYFCHIRGRLEIVSVCGGQCEVGRTEWKQTILGVGALGTVLPASLGLGVAAVAVAGVCGIRVLGALTEELALPSVGQHKSFFFFFNKDGVAQRCKI